jgi:hypothetical protein
VKAAGDHWVVQEKKGGKVFSRGVWAPAETVERIRADLDAQRATESVAKRREADAKRRTSVFSGSKFDNIRKDHCYAKHYNRGGFWHRSEQESVLFTSDQSIASDLPGSIDCPRMGEFPAR